MLKYRDQYGNVWNVDSVESRVPSLRIHCNAPDVGAWSINHAMSFCQGTQCILRFWPDWRHTRQHTADSKYTHLQINSTVSTNSAPDFSSFPSFRAAARRLSASVSIGGGHLRNELVSSYRLPDSSHLQAWMRSILRQRRVSQSLDAGNVKVSCHFDVSNNAVKMTNMTNMFESRSCSYTRKVHLDKLQQSQQLTAGAKKCVTAVAHKKHCRSDQCLFCLMASLT